MNRCGFKKDFKKQSGYTLIEVLVSVAIFSLVMVAALGSILSIIDANRKSRTLASVMNNVHYTVEYMTRALKTGKDIHKEVHLGEDYLFVDSAINGVVGFGIKEEDGGGSIVRRIGNSEIALTSPEVDIERFSFDIWDSGPNGQPRVLLNVTGFVKASEKVQSRFSIQTTVSQRDLDF